MPAVGSLPFIILALLGFGFVIAIHEFGHFVFAKLAGVKVLRFSIGFGPIIAAKQIGETEYALSLLPLGGYVKMLGEENAAQGPTEGDASDPRSYVNASRPWKALILLGGVTFNLVSSWLILLGLAFYGMPMTPPIAAVVDGALSVDGKPVPSPAKQLGLLAGDRITKVDGHVVRSFDEVQMRIAVDNGEPIELDIERDGKPMHLPVDGARVYAVAGDRLPEIGIAKPYGRTVFEVRRLSGDAADTDPRPGDEVVAVAGERLRPEAMGQRVDELLRPRIGQDVSLTLRDEHGAERSSSFRYAGRLSPADWLAASPLELPVQVDAVMPGSPAETAGLRGGDIVESVAGRRVRNAGEVSAIVKSSDSLDLAIVAWRGPERRELTAHLIDDGRRQLGVSMTPLMGGRLPFLPPGLDGGAGALAAAGMASDDALLLRLPSGGEAKKGGDAPICYALAGAEQLPVAIADADETALTAHGWFGRPPPLSRMSAVRLVERVAGSDAATFADVDGVGFAMDLGFLAPATRQALAETLKPGDWLAGLRRDDQGRRALIVLRSAAKPRVLTIKPPADGVAVMLTPYYEPPYVLKGGASEAFAIANGAAYDMVDQTLRLIPRFFRPAEKGGIAATQTLSGPIGIFSEFKTRAERLGFASFLKLVALIGLNLFLVNLLPIPIVDGGQLVFLGIEALIRRPVPEPVRAVANYAGFALVLALMAFSLGIDIWRKLGWL